MKKATAKKPSSGKPARHNGKTGKEAGSHEATQGSALHDFFIDGLKDMYWAEKHLVKSLPKMASAASTGELRNIFEDHLYKTEEHVSKLEEVFQLLDVKAQPKKCEGIDGLTREADKTIEETEKNTMTRDVALIIAAQKVEHYEIAAYGGLTQLAHTMGLEEVARILGQVFQEEKEADMLLSELAERSINIEAEQEA